MAEASCLAQGPSPAASLSRRHPAHWCLNGEKALEKPQGFIHLAVWGQVGGRCAGVQVCRLCRQGSYLPAMSGLRRTTMTESPRRNILEM